MQKDKSEYIILYFKCIDVNSLIVSITIDIILGLHMFMEFMMKKAYVSLIYCLAQNIIL